jgi:hypothetical protein
MSVAMLIVNKLIVIIQSCRGAYQAVCIIELFNDRNKFSSVVKYLGFILLELK